METHIVAWYSIVVAALIHAYIVETMPEQSRMDRAKYSGVGFAAVFAALYFGTRTTKGGKSFLTDPF